MEEAAAASPAPGAQAALGRAALPAVLVYGAAVLVQGAALRSMIDGPDFPWDGPPIGGVAEVAVSLAAVSVAAWFMRTTLLEIALDFRRKQRNMRPLLRATALLGAAAAGAAALWGLAVAVFHVRGVALILLPLPALWLARSVGEGWAAARLYGKPPAVTVPLALAFGLVTLVVAFVAVCSVNSGYLRVVESFRG